VRALDPIRQLCNLPSRHPPIPERAAISTLEHFNRNEAIKRSAIRTFGLVTGAALAGTY
jgi:hypothetical protein